MKRRVIVFVFVLLLSVENRLSAQDPVTLIIKEAVVRVIRAVDLQIQRIQNETIWLQNAQKTVENTMAKLRLAAIADWAEKQKLLYQDYFEELQRVKEILTYYHQVRDILSIQKNVVQDYGSALRAVRGDPNLSPTELAYVQKVLAGILQQVLLNIEEVETVVQSFTMQMSDGARMTLIERAGSDIQREHNDLKRFVAEYKQLSLSRAKDAKEVALVKALYGQ